jgi:hypothetical protein|tara:strand:+ start:1729 stop:1866 length:138 start_codon:yes stop_codon:yes gene_type:complete
MTIIYWNEIDQFIAECVEEDVLNDIIRLSKDRLELLNEKERNNEI